MHIDIINGVLLTMNARFYYKYLSLRIASKWTVLFVDVLLVVFSVLFAHFLQAGMSAFILEFPIWGWATLLCVICNICFFHFTKTYIGVIRYSSFVDIARVFISLTLGYGVVFFCNLFRILCDCSAVLSGSVILTAYIINFSLMVGLRILVKLLYEQMTFDRKHCINIFIYGSKGAGVNIAKSLRVNRKNHFRLKGFISDDSGFIGKQTMGCRVYANDEQLFEALTERRIRMIIVPPEKIRKLETSGMIERLIAMDIRVLTVPPLSDWNEEGNGLVQTKDIQIEDLLQRESIQIDMRKILSCIEGKRVMITGAAGSIGREMVRQIASLNPYSLILVDQAESPLHDVQLEMVDNWREVSVKILVADVTNQARMECLFYKYHPQYVFHAAAYKHVPMMEDNVSEAVQVNVLGTRVVADLSVKYKVETFVMVSTDKAVNPTNVMGCSKRIAEIYVQSLARKLAQEEGGARIKIVTTRFGNVLGSNGSVIPRFKQQIERGGPVTVTHLDVIRYFMTIPEACRLVLEAGCMGKGGEIYIFDMGDPVKIYDLAKRMIYLSGRRGVKIEFTGLRHGEKLYEELLNIKESTCPTYHEKIMIAKVREYNFNEVQEKILQLVELSYNSDAVEVVSLMKELVPEFISKNSIFEMLDKSAF